MLFPTLSHRQWLALLFIASLLAGLFVLPYVLGHTLAPTGTVYTGLFNNIDDGTYLSAIEQGRQGHWTYRNLFTSEEHEAAYIEGFYLALGWLARLFGLSTTAIWHIGLFAADVVFFVLVFHFVAFFFPNPFQRKVAFALVVLGGGFDWFAFPVWLERPNTLEAIPVDLHMPEVHPFFSALTYPHFMAGISLIILIFWFAFLAVTAAPGDGRRWWLAVAAGVCNLLLAIVYPFILLLIASVLGAYCLYLLGRRRQFLWRPVLVLVITFAVPAPLLIYYASVLLSNPIMQQWSDQAITLSPNPLHFLLAYLPYLVLALLTLRLLRKPAGTPQQDAFVFLWTWVIVALCLLYAPVVFQRRFVEGLQIPLAMLATIGLFERALPRLSSSRLFRTLAQRPRYTMAGLQRLVVVWLIAGTSLINLFIYTAVLIKLTGEQPYPLFRPQGEVEAMGWLKNNTMAEDVILTAYWTGSWLPSQAGRRVVLGHFYETAFFLEKESEVSHFFGVATADEWRQQFLMRYDVTYVFWGRSERELGTFDPASADYLEPVFETEQVSLYQVRPAQE
jgi:hypothetical protein